MFLLSGDIIRHYKGGVYTVLFRCYNANNTADREDMVCYVSHTTGKVFVRNLSEMADMVDIGDGIKVIRFLLINPTNQTRE